METGLPLQQSIPHSLFSFEWIMLSLIGGFIQEKFPKINILLLIVFPESGGCTIILFLVARKTKMEQTPVNFDLVMRS